LASHDPSWLVHTIGFTRETHCFEWPKDLLAQVESLVEMDDPSLTHLILGRLWWAARIRRAHDSEFATRAVGHLSLVEPRHRLGKYYEELGEALAVVDPAQLEELANTILSNVPSYNVADVRHDLLEGAARASNWEAYDRHRAAYDRLQKCGQAQAHDYCEVLNLDGLTALARGRAEEIPKVMTQLIESGRNVAFLGGPDTLRLVKALVERREYLPACRKYLRMIHAPSANVMKMLADVEALLGSQGKRKKTTIASRKRGPESKNRKRGK
jgi:hypothetical protein